MILVFSVAAAITGSLALCLLFFQATRKTYPGFGHWTAGAGIIAAGYLLFGLRGIIPLWVSVFVGNLAVPVGLLCQLDGIKLFLGFSTSRWPYWVVSALLASALAIFSFHWDSVYWRGVSTSLPMIAVQWYMAALLFRSSRSPRSLFIKAIGSLLVIGGCLVLARIVWFSFPLYSSQIWTAESEALFFIGFVTVHLGESFSMVMLNAERLEIELLGAHQDLSHSVNSLQKALTLQKEAEESLRESEERYRTFFDTSRDAVFLTTLDGRSIDFNEVALELLGYANSQRHEVLGRSVNEFYAHPEEREAHAAKVAELGFSKECPVDLRRQDGAIIHTLITTVARKDHQGTIIGFQGTVRDITESKKALEELAASRSELHAIYDSSPVMMCVLDGQRQVVYANKALTKFVGKTEDELKSGAACGVFGCINALDDPRGCGHGPKCEFCPIRTALEDSSKTGVIHRAIEYRTTLVLDGRHREVVLQGSTARVKTDGQSSVLLCLEDITDRKEREEALRFTQFVLDHMTESVFWIKPDSSFAYVNEAACTRLGYTKEELLALGVPDLDPDFRYKDWAHYWGSIKQGGSRTFQSRHRTKTGEVFPVEIRKDFLCFEGKDYICTLVRDITERTRSEEMALQAARLRSVADLSSGVAHHFNNLLQMVMGGASLALDDLESGDLEEAKSYLKKMLPMVKRGAEVVERLQTFGSTRADATVREQLSFDVAATVRNAAELSKPLWMADVEKRGTKIGLHLDLKDGCLVKGQEAEISEVMINLLRNAVEALPHDGIIEVKTIKDSDDVVVSVQDTGEGIPEEDLPHIFQPFWTTKGFELGKGMGLAVAHGLIKRHGGEMSVRSKAGEGTTIIIRLPLSSEPFTKVEKPVAIEVERFLTILVIEDEEHIASLLERILEKSGHKVFTAFSGKDGLAIFEKGHVDLVLCDLGMPGMSGWEVGKAIRSICKEKGIAKPPFVLLTGWGRQQLEKEKIAESGTDAVLSKPIASATLLSKVQEIVAGLK